MLSPRNDEGHSAQPLPDWVRRFPEHSRLRFCAEAAAAGDWLMLDMAGNINRVVPGTWNCPRCLRVRDDSPYCWDCLGMAAETAIRVGGMTNRLGFFSYLLDKMETPEDFETNCAADDLATPAPERNHTLAA